ncbi:hypothetical protein MPER_02559 [Moniliophthora perniciosa FA553]|nr:hypothetical protein MPER_02559 [Moniliophthora perniciosa FA553]
MSYEKLLEPVTILGLFNVTVVIDEIQQWPIQIHGKQSQVITLWDLLSGVYEALHRRVTHQDHDGMPKRFPRRFCKMWTIQIFLWRQACGSGNRRRIEAGGFFEGKDKHGVGYGGER